MTLDKRKIKRLEAPVISGGLTKAGVRASIRAAKTTKEIGDLKNAAEAMRLKPQWMRRSKRILRELGLGKEIRHKPPKGGHPF